MASEGVVSVVGKLLVDAPPAYATLRDLRYRRSGAGYLVCMFFCNAFEGDLKLVQFRRSPSHKWEGIVLPYFQSLPAGV